jgi:hypothetical protein
MATHKIVLEVPFADQRVGNSISTRTSFDGQTLTVSWKGQAKSFPAKPGDRALIACNGEMPEVIVMQPPADPVARAAWNRSFYAKKRFGSLAALEAAAAKLERYSAPHGCNVSAAKFYRSANCVIVYRAVAGGQIGVPWGWYAGPEATPEEMTELIEGALSGTLQARSK